MKVFVECYPDAELIKFIGNKADSVTHSQGKGNVINSLLKTNSPIAFGIIDEDPHSTPIPALKHFKVADKTPDMILYEHKNDNNKKLIILKPRLEEWLYKTAKSANIDPSSFGFPNSSNELHKIPRYDKMKNFIDLINSLKDSQDFHRLKEWLNKK
ncbi:MAG: hypothetical protein ACP5MG_10365 [Verrucomicrobiia bacterium]|jgi:hypothetical protein